MSESKNKNNNNTNNKRKDHDYGNCDSSGGNPHHVHNDNDTSDDDGRSLNDTLSSFSPPPPPPPKRPKLMKRSKRLCGATTTTTTNNNNNNNNNSHHQHCTSTASSSSFSSERYNDKTLDGVPRKEPASLDTGSNKTVLSASNSSEKTTTTNDKPLIRQSANSSSSKPATAVERPVTKFCDTTPQSTLKRNLCTDGPRIKPSQFYDSSRDNNNSSSRDNHQEAGVTLFSSSSSSNSNSSPPPSITNDHQQNAKNSSLSLEEHGGNDTTLEMIGSKNSSSPRGDVDSGDDQHFTSAPSKRDDDKTLDNQQHSNAIGGDIDPSQEQDRVVTKKNPSLRERACERSIQKDPTIVDSVLFKRVGVTATTTSKTSSPALEGDVESDNKTTSMTCDDKDVEIPSSSSGTTTTTTAIDPGSVSTTVNPQDRIESSGHDKASAASLDTDSNTTDDKKKMMDVPRPPASNNGTMTTDEQDSSLFSSLAGSSQQLPNNNEAAAASTSRKGGDSIPASKDDQQDSLLSRVDGSNTEDQQSLNNSNEPAAASIDDDSMEDEQLQLQQNDNHNSNPAAESTSIPASTPKVTTKPAASPSLSASHSKSIQNPPNLSGTSSIGMNSTLNITKSSSQQAAEKENNDTVQDTNTSPSSIMQINSQRSNDNGAGLEFSSNSTTATTNDLGRKSETSTKSTDTGTKQARDGGIFNSTTNVQPTVDEKKQKQQVHFSLPINSDKLSSSFQDISWSPSRGSHSIPASTLHPSQHSVPASLNLQLPRSSWEPVVGGAALPGSDGLAMAAGACILTKFVGSKRTSSSRGDPKSRKSRRTDRVSSPSYKKVSSHSESGSYSKKRQILGSTTDEEEPCAVNQKGVVAQATNSDHAEQGSSDEPEVDASADAVHGQKGPKNSTPSNTTRDKTTASESSPQALLHSHDHSTAAKDSQNDAPPLFREDEKPPSDGTCGGAKKHESALKARPPRGSLRQLHSSSKDKNQSTSKDDTLCANGTRVQAAPISCEPTPQSKPRRPFSENEQSSNAGDSQSEAPPLFQEGEKPTSQSKPPLSLHSVKEHQNTKTNRSDDDSSAAKSGMLASDATTTNSNNAIRSPHRDDATEAATAEDEDALVSDVSKDKQTTTPTSAARKRVASPLGDGSSSAPTATNPSPNDDAIAGQGPFSRLEPRATASDSNKNDSSGHLAENEQSSSKTANVVDGKQSAVNNNESGSFVDEDGMSPQQTKTQSSFYSERKQASGNTGNVVGGNLDFDIMGMEEEKAAAASNRQHDDEELDVQEDEETSKESASQAEKKIVRHLKPQRTQASSDSVRRAVAGDRGESTDALHTTTTTGDGTVSAGVLSLLDGYESSSSEEDEDENENEKAISSHNGGDRDHPADDSKPSAGSLHPQKQTNNVGKDNHDPFQLPETEKLATPAVAAAIDNRNSNSLRLSLPLPGPDSSFEKNLQGMSPIPTASPSARNRYAAAASRRDGSQETGGSIGQEVNLEATTVPRSSSERDEEEDNRGVGRDAEVDDDEQAQPGSDDESKADTGIDGKQFVDGDENGRILDDSNVTAGDKTTRPVQASSTVGGDTSSVRPTGTGEHVPAQSCGVNTSEKPSSSTTFTSRSTDGRDKHKESNQGRAAPPDGSKNTQQQDDRKESTNPEDGEAVPLDGEVDPVDENENTTPPRATDVPGSHGINGAAAVELESRALSEGENNVKTTTASEVNASDGAQSGSVTNSQKDAQGMGPLRGGSSSIDSATEGTTSDEFDAQDDGKPSAIEAAAADATSGDDEPQMHANDDDTIRNDAETNDHEEEEPSDPRALPSENRTSSVSDSTHSSESREASQASSTFTSAASGKTASSSRPAGASRAAGSVAIVEQASSSVSHQAAIATEAGVGEGGSQDNTGAEPETDNTHMPTRETTTSAIQQETAARVNMSSMDDTENSAAGASSNNSTTSSGIERERDIEGDTSALDPTGEETAHTTVHDDGQQQHGSDLDAMIADAEDRDEGFPINNDDDGDDDDDDQSAAQQHEEELLRGSTTVGEANANGDDDNPAARRLAAAAATDRGGSNDGTEGGTSMQLGEATSTSAVPTSSTASTSRSQPAGASNAPNAATTEAQTEDTGAEDPTAGEDTQSSSRSAARQESDTLQSTDTSTTTDVAARSSRAVATQQNGGRPVFEDLDASGMGRETRWERYEILGCEARDLAEMMRPWTGRVVCSENRGGKLKARMELLPTRKNIPMCYNRYRGNTKWKWLFIPGATVRVKIKKEKDPTPDNTNLPSKKKKKKKKEEGTKWVVNYFYLDEGTESFEPEEHTVTETFLEWLFTARTMRLLKECVKQGHEDWLIVGTPICHQSYVDLLIFVGARRRPGQGEGDEFISNNGDVVVFDPEDKVFDSLVLRSSEENNVDGEATRQVVPQDIDAELERRKVTKNPVPVKFPCGNTTIAENYVFAKPLVRIDPEFRQSSLSYECLPRSFFAAAYEVEHLRPRAKPAFRKVIAFDISKVPMAERDDRMRGLIQKHLKGHNFVKWKDFDPLNPDHNNHHLPVLFKPRGYAHALTMFDNKIFEPSLEYPLVVNESNLHKLCGGDYRGIAAAYKLQERENQKEKGKKKSKKTNEKTNPTEGEVERIANSVSEQAAEDTSIEQGFPQVPAEHAASLTSATTEMDATDDETEKNAQCTQKNRQSQLESKPETPLVIETTEEESKLSATHHAAKANILPEQPSSAAGTRSSQSEGLTIQQHTAGGKKKRRRKKNRGGGAASLNVGGSINGVQQHGSSQNMAAAAQLALPEKDEWQYIDTNGNVQGSYSTENMRSWQQQGYFRATTKVKKIGRHADFATISTLGIDVFAPYNNNHNHQNQAHAHAATSKQAVQSTSVPHLQPVAPGGELSLTSRVTYRDPATSMWSNEVTVKQLCHLLNSPVTALDANTEVRVVTDTSSDAPTHAERAGSMPILRHVVRQFHYSHNGATAGPFSCRQLALLKQRGTQIDHVYGASTGGAWIPWDPLPSLLRDLEVALTAFSS